MTEVASAPYPADTRARGWRFEVDMEKVKASETWLRAKSGALRGALLLLWAEAWQQTPCGTLPNDDELIALLIDMAPAAFTKARSVLMRGWWLAEDGRLYHDTITDRVLSMLDKRASDAQRAAARRARMSDAAAIPPEVATESRVTPNGLGGEFDTKHQAPSTSNSSSPPGKKKARAAALSVGVEALLAEGFDEGTAREFIAFKDAKKAPLTARAWADHLRESKLAGWTPVAAAEKVMARSWKGFEAKYVANERAPAAAQSEPTYARHMREVYEKNLPAIAAKRPGSDKQITIDMEAPHGAPLALG